MFLGGHKVAKILYIGLPIVTMVNSPIVTMVNTRHHKHPGRCNSLREVLARRKPSEAGWRSFSVVTIGLFTMVTIGSPIYNILATL